MPEKPRPLSPDDAPEPASHFGRERPHAEAGLGRLETNPDATPVAAPDVVDGAVPNKQPLRQINAEDVVDGQAGRKLGH
jgi:hypothetical protein